MKNRMIIALCICLAVSVTACSQRNNTNEPTTSQSQSVSENPLAPSEQEQEEQNTPAFVEDDAFYQSILLTYGSEIATDEAGKPYLRITKGASLFDKSGWYIPQELDAYDYYLWYMTMMWQEDISIEERQEKYESPFGEDTGWFFPQDLFEPLVQKYFDVSIEYLRSNPNVYSEEYKGYSVGGGGGFGESPPIILEKVESDDDIRKLYVRLDYEYQEAQNNRILTVKLEPDGGYKFESYTIAEQRAADNNPSEPEKSQWNPADYPDPTLPENMQAVFYNWEHLEYLAFEQPSEYKTVEVIPTGFEDEEQRIIMSIRLPSVYSFGEYNRIMYDGGFQELLPSGDIVYCDIYDNSKGFIENALFIAKQRSVDFMLGGANYDMTQQNDNTPGSYIANDKFVRCVFGSNMGNHEVVYIVKAMTDAYVAIKFEVSAQADVNDLALYDAIAESVQVLD